MKAIYKYSLQIIDEQTISMPKDAKILTIETLYNQPMLWANVDCAKEYEPVTIITLPTGSTLVEYEDMSLEYIGSYQLGGGNFVGHVFVKR